MKNVLLVCGGKSYEHDISVVTAVQIYNKTKIEDVNLVLLYVSRDEKFYVCTVKKIDVFDFSQEKFNAKSKKFKEVVFVSSEKGKLFEKTLLGLKEYISSNVAIFCTHGGDGENGKLVALFESVGIFCTAGDVCSLGITMNKYFFKQFAKGSKIPVVSGFLIKKQEYEKNKKLFEFKANVLKFPLVLKPNNGGSSIGLFVADNKNEFESKLNETFEFENEVIVEKFISGCREFNVAVLGIGEDLQVSEIDEPVKNQDVLTFADKYLSGESGNKIGGKKCSMSSQKRDFPKNLPEELVVKIKSLAIKTFKSLNLCGVVRIDFLFDENSGKLYVCEVNAIPGSLAYYFFDNGRYLINSMVEKLIEIAKNKDNYYKKIQTEFLTDVLK